MIKNLELTSDAVTECSAQVCVIGAGTAGLFLARQLHQKGLQVVVLEAGDSVARKPLELDQDCEQHGIRYRGAELGRSFGLGGTSVLWGGQMLPLSREDMAGRPSSGIEAWPVCYEDLSPYFSEVGKVLGIELPSESYGGSDAGWPQSRYPELGALDLDFDLRLSAWLPFKKRNFARAFEKDIFDNDGLTVWLRASVTELQRDSASGHPIIDRVIAQSANGRSLHVRASAVVVCAGALESTRLLLAFDEETGNSISKGGAPLGRYFSDHLSVTCGRLHCLDWKKYNQAVAPIFARGLMRTPRLELSAQAQQRLGVSSAFAHFTFLTRGDTGFDVVRSFLRRRQGEVNTTKLTPARAARAVVDLSAMAWWRGIYRQLWIPRGADLLLQVDIEQTPNPASQLILSDRRDKLGRKRLIIDWRITPADISVIRTVAELAITTWRASSLCSVADVEPMLPDRFDSFDSLYDVYHPTGTLRMGSAASNSVVNKDLKLWAADNCFVTTTAVFPSAGSANPGLTHLALTARLAERVAMCLRPAAWSKS